MKKLFTVFIFSLWAASAFGVGLVLQLDSGQIDTVAIDRESQLYFSDPDMVVTRLVSPVNGAINVPQLAEFSWQHVMDRNVELLISESLEFTDTTYHISGIDTNVYRLEHTLEIQKRYYWKVRIEGEELWTAPWYFNTYMPTLPDQLESIALFPTKVGGHIELRASYDAEIDSFLVVYGSDGLSFPDTCFCDTATIKTIALQPDNLYYLKIAGMNGAGTGPLSEVLAIRTRVSEDYVCIVNGFDRSTSGNSKDFIRQHARAIDALGYTVFSATNEAITDNLFNLSFAGELIYILGEESTADETFSNTEQDRVEAYLKSGGHLFISGAEIAWDLDYKGSTADKAFCHNYLKLAYRQDAPNGATGTYYNVQAIGDTIFSDLNSFAFDNGTHGTYNVRYPDVYTPQNGARSFLKYTGCNTGAAGIVYEGMFPGGSSEGKIMVLGFPFETVYPEDARNAIMREFFQFSEQGLDVIDIALPEEHRLLPNYPNPFNPSTTISYQLSAIAKVDLAIYDLNGRKVETLVSKVQSAGSHELSWNAVGHTSGLYFVVFKVDGCIVGTRKMMLVK